MPWLSIIMALLGFFKAKKSGASNTEALLIGGLAGGATYYVTHETDWGRANLGDLDGYKPSTAAPLAGAGGTAVPDPTKPGSSIPSVIPVGGSTTVTPGGTGVYDVLKSWGATGTAKVLGTAAVAGGALTGTLPKWLLPVGLGIGALLLLRS